MDYSHLFRGILYNKYIMCLIWNCRTHMDYSSIFWGHLLILLFISCARRWIFATQLPPGPFPLPIVGNIFILGNKPHKSLAKLAKIYGSLMTIKLGSVTTIVVSSASMAKQVLQKNDQSFSSRTVPDAARALRFHEASSVFLPSNLQWRNLRKLCATQMFSVERLNGNQEMRQEKVNHLIEYIREKAKSRVAIDIGQVVYSNTLNIISNALFSIDLTNFGTESGQDFKAIFRGVLEEVGKPNLSDYFPLLRPFDFQGIRRQVCFYFKKLDDLFDDIIDQRLQSKEKHTSNDLLDALFHYPQENGFKLGLHEMKCLLKDLFIAGTDTSSGTLEWAMTELLQNREVLVKARLELKGNIKDDKLIEESDIARLPYIQAIVKETLRLHPSAPFLVPHKAETDVEMCGFTVPRHAQMLVNAWAIGRDPEMWDNPNSFIPDRFLDSNVDYRGQDFGFIPFGAGRRICPGLPLAHRVVNLTLASLVRSFDWELEDGRKPEDINMEEKFGLTLSKAEPLLVIPIEV